MKILFITDNFPPEVNAPATRTYEHVKEWIKEDDVEVTVLTCFPNFPHGKVYEGYRNRVYQKENIDGIEVVRVWSYITQNKGFLKRSLDYFSFGVSSFIAGLFLKYDIIIATSPQFFTTWSAWGLSKIKRKPWIFELRDLWPESIKAVGASKNENLLKLLEKIELGLYNNADLIVSVTKSFKENLIRRGIDESKIKTIYNGANLELFKPRHKDLGLLQELGLRDKFIFGYIGTHGMAHKLDFILECAREIKDKEVHFLFIGDGAEKERLLELAKKYRLHNITFLDPIKKEDVPKYLSIIDVSLVPLKKSDLFKTVIPSKMFESCAMQKPIFLGADGEAREIIEKYGAGIYFEPENKEDFLSKIDLFKDDLVYRNFQYGCKNLAENFDRKKLAKDFIYILLSLFIT